MPENLYDEWCECKAQAISAGRQLHLFSEKKGARASAQPRIKETVNSHYEDPETLAERAGRRGYEKASKLLELILPQTKKARSGHMGEILATEVVPAVLPQFEIPIKRLRWLDGRES